MKSSTQSSNFLVARSLDDATLIKSFLRSRYTDSSRLTQPVPFSQFCTLEISLDKGRAVFSVSRALWTKPSTKSELVVMTVLQRLVRTIVGQATIDLGQEGESIHVPI